MSCASCLDGLLSFYYPILSVCTLNYHSSNTISSQAATDTPTGEGDLQLAQSLVNMSSHVQGGQLDFKAAPKSLLLPEDMIYLWFKIRMPKGLQH